MRERLKKRKRKRLWCLRIRAKTRLADPKKGAVPLQCERGSSWGNRAKRTIMAAIGDSEKSKNNIKVEKA